MTISTVVLFGDSYTAAFNSSAVAQGGLGSWGEQLAERLGDLKIFGPLISSGCILPSNAAWGRAGTWTRALITDAFDKCPYDQSYYGTTTTDITTFTRPTQWRTPVGFAIYWVDHAAGGDWQYRLDGGSYVNMGQTRVQDNSLNKFYVNTAFSSTVDIRCFNGTSNVGALIVGIELFWANPTTAASGVIVHNLAVAGNLLDTLTKSGAGDGMAFLDAIKLGSGSPPSSAPNVATIMEYANDVALADTTGFAADLTTIRNRAAPLAPIIFLSPWDNGANPTDLAAYHAQAKTSAAAYSPAVTVVDLLDEWAVLGFTGNAATIAGGFIDGTSHPAQPGNDKIAERLYHELRANVLTARIGPYRNYTISGTSQSGSTTDVQAGFPGASVATADTAGGTDVVTRSRVSSRSVADTAGATDVVTRISTRSRAVADTAGGSDAVTRGALVESRSTADTAGGSDVVTRSTVRARSVADTAGVTDVVTRTVANARSVADTAGASDAVTRGTLVQARATADTAGASDVVSRAITESRSVADTAGVTDAVARTSARSCSIADTAGATDVVARSLIQARSTADTAGGTDSVATFGIARTTADTAGGSDAVTRALADARATADTAGGTDAVTRSSAKSRSTADTAGGSDSITRGRVSARALADSVGGTDAVTRVLNRVRASSDTAGGTDTTARVLRLFRTVADTAGGTDLATAITSGSSTVQAAYTAGIPQSKYAVGIMQSKYAEGTLQSKYEVGSMT